MAAPASRADDASMDTTMTDEPPQAPPPPSPSPPRPGRHLTRSRDDRVLGGVAGGLAHTYGWDPGLVRVIIAVAAVVTGGAIAVAYGIAWLVVPEDTTGLTGAETFRGRPLRHARENWALPVGIVLVAAGMFTVADRFAWGPFRQLFWPVTLIAGGLAVLLVRHRDPALESDTGTDTAAGRADGDTAPAGTPTTTEPAGAATPASTTLEQPTVGAYPSYGPWPTTAPVATLPPPAPREHSMLSRLTWSALLLLAGCASLLAVTGAADVDPGFVLTLALVVVGLALVVGAWFGRGRGLIALAIILVLVCSVDVALDVPLTGGIGEHIYRVQGASTLQRNYDLAIGHLVVDLRNVTTADRTLRIDARDAIGQLEIFVPANAALDVRTRVGVGDLQLFGEPDNGGWRVDQRFQASGTGPHFVIDARVGFGQLVVRQAPSNDPGGVRTASTAHGGRA